MWQHTIDPVNNHHNHHHFAAIKKELNQTIQLPAQTNPPTQSNYTYAIIEQTPSTQ